MQVAPFFADLNIQAGRQAGVDSNIWWRLSTAGPDLTAAAGIIQPAFSTQGGAGFFPSSVLVATWCAPTCSRLSVVTFQFPRLPALDRRYCTTQKTQPVANP